MKNKSCASCNLSLFYYTHIFCGIKSCCFERCLLLMDWTLKKKHMQLTGRVEEKRRWSEGIHQAVEAKEGLKIQVSWCLTLGYEVCSAHFYDCVELIWFKVSIFTLVRLIQLLWHKSHINHSLSFTQSCQGWLGLQKRRYGC